MKNATSQRRVFLGFFPLWLRILFILTICVLLGLGGWFYYSQISDLKDQTYKSLEAIAQSKVDQVLQWRSEQLRNGALLMESPFLSTALTNWLSSNKNPATDDILVRFQSMKKFYGLSDVLVMDRVGRKRFALSGYGGHLHLSAAEAMDRAFREHQPVLTDLHCTPGFDDPHIDVVVPILEKHGDVTKEVGAIILQQGAGHFLFPLIQSWPVPSSTGETLLVRREADHVLFLNELRHRKGTALKLCLPLTQKELPSVMAVSGTQGIVRGKDYRGAEVLSVLKAVPDSPWFLVTKIDTREALSQVRRLSSLVLAALIGLAVAALAVVAVFWQRSESLHYQSLFKAEAAAIQSEEKYKVTLMSVGDGVIVTGKDGLIQLLNPVSETLTGWTNEEAHGKPFDEVFKIINEKTRKAAQNPVAQAIRENKAVELANHTALITRNGREIPIEDSAAPIRDTEGAPIGAIIVFHDVTQQRKAESALRKAHDELEIRVQERTADLARQAELLQLAHDAIIVRDMDDRITFWNGGAEEIYGWTAVEATGAIIHQLLHTEFPESLEVMKERILLEGRWEGELVQLRKDQGRITILSRRVLRKDQDLPTAIMEIDIDITERKNAELVLKDTLHELESRMQELSQTHEELVKEIEEREMIEHQLRQSQKLETVGTLAAGIAHDFNNILSAVIGFSEMARDRSPEGSDIRMRIEKAIAAGLRGRDLVRRVLTFSRKADPDMRPLHFATLVKETVNLLRSAVPSMIDIVINVGEESPMVQADGIQMQQVLMNLGMNAAHALEGKAEGIISFNLESMVVYTPEDAPHSHLSPGQYLKLTVSDNGIGMPPDVLERVFDPFFTTKKAGHGTGLGLSVVHGIVANHRGAITVSSTVGAGTTFSVYLPYLNGKKEDQSLDKNYGSIPEGNERILFIDDEEPLTEWAHEMGTELGYTITAMTDASVALTIFSQDPSAFDMIITDYAMPGLSGVQLAMKVRTVRPNIPILLCTGFNPTSDKEMENAAIDAVIFKPLTKSELAVAIRQVLVKRGKN